MTGTPKNAVEFILSKVRSEEFKHKVKGLDIEFEIQNNLYGKDYFKLSVSFNFGENYFPSLEEFRERIITPYESTIDSALEAESYIKEYEFFNSVMNNLNLIKKLLFPNIESIEWTNLNDVENIINKHIPYRRFIKNKIWEISRNQRDNFATIKCGDFTIWEYEKQEAEKTKKELERNQSLEDFWKNKTTIASEGDLVFFKNYNSINCFIVEEISKSSEKESYDGSVLKKDLTPHTTRKASHIYPENILIILSPQNLETIRKDFFFSEDKQSLFNILKKGYADIPTKYTNNKLIKECLDKDIELK